MSDVPRSAEQAGPAGRVAAEQLLPLVYDELRRLAARRLAGEKPGQTLDATALVHEAYLRLVGGQQFENRRHFYAAAAEAMRRILVERARARHSRKAGGGRTRVDLEAVVSVEPDRDDQLLALDAALERLAAAEPQAAELVRLRYFAGCTTNEAAGLLGMSLRSANRLWAYAKAWLLEEFRRE
jgi:RNA polymerase sigma factor (TIGR02999 family)